MRVGKAVSWKRLGRYAAEREEVLSLESEETETDRQTDRQRALSLARARLREGDRQTDRLTD